jgi:16S rRNA (cytidine1402-2'-O)-methyltransferase
MSIAKGTLYVVATPIGNLDDLTPRAAEILRQADLICAEDTRRCRTLLGQCGANTPTLAYHEHNERKLLERVLERLREGAAIALVSDAGTPLVSDPGFPLVRACHQHGIPVSPIPGPSAAIAALSASGLPSDRFVFEGFLPRSPAQRRSHLEGLTGEPRTLVFYEASHRILESLADLAAVFGADHPAVLAKELTKVHERILAAPLGELHDRLSREPELQRGEFVLLLGGAEPAAEGLPAEARRTLEILLGELPLKQAVALAARITGLPRNALYAEAVARRQGKD